MPTKTHWSLIIVLTVMSLLFNVTIINAAQIVNKEQILFSGQNLNIAFMGYRYSGPYTVASGKTIHVEWAADRLVSVYILNEVDWENWPKYGGPPSYRIMKTSQSGNVQFKVQYSDNFFVVVMGFAGTAARLYRWTEKLKWQEIIAGSLKIIVKGQDGTPLKDVYIIISGPESHNGYTNHNGELAFNNLSPGQYTITSSKNGFKTTTTTSTVHRDATTQTSITLTQLNQEPSFNPQQSHADSNTLPFAIIATVICSAFVITVTLYYKHSYNKHRNI